MKKFINYILIGCMSFTFSCLFYLIFSYVNILPPFDEELIISMFFISFGIVSLMALIHLVSIQNLVLLRFLEIMVVMVVLFLAGAFFNLFPLNLYYSGFVMIVGLLTYIVIAIVSFINNQASARKINASIRSKERIIKNE